MSNRFDLLTQELFQKNVSDCSVEELKRLAEQYPYFAPAQYALLKKLEQTASEDYQQQLQKSVLYYHNPAGFNQFINDFNVVDFEFESFTEQEISAPVEEDKTTERIVEEQSFVEEQEEVITQEEDLEDDRQEDFEPGPEIELPQAIKDQLPSLESIKSSAPQANGTADATLTFEPYHTIDYFASQGIKLSQDEATKDRFGRQLKSFTEWLKTMKKLPVAEQAKPIDIIAEQKVENLAAHSVEESDIVTETMAEVWIKQGKREKAIEVYNKLSLLNPSKNAYFAAKVEFLKKEI